MLHVSSTFDLIIYLAKNVNCMLSINICSIDTNSLQHVYKYYTINFNPILKPLSKCMVLIKVR